MKDIRKAAAENKFCKNIAELYNKYTSYINFPTKHSKWVLVIYIIVALTAFAISVNGRYNQLDAWKSEKAYFFYNDTPMMTTLDAYKYIRHAKEINNNEYEPGGNDVKIFYPEGVPFYNPTPLLSTILAKLHNITGYDYYNIAINMVPWLSSIFILVLCAYFYIAGYPAIGALAGLLTSFSIGYMIRSSIGRFDTDGGNLFFLFTASLFIYLASIAKKEYVTYIFSALLGLTILGFAFFYNHILFNLVFFIVFIVSLFIYNKSYKNILIASLIYIVTSNPVYFASSVTSLIGSMSVYIPFLPNNFEATSPVPWVYNTISEAAAEPFSGIVRFTTQNPVTFIIGLLAGILFLISNIRKSIALLPIFAMGLMVFVSSGRFAMFLMPFIAIGYGYLLYIISHYLIEKFGNNLEHRLEFTKAMLPLVLAFFILSISFGSNHTAYGFVPAPSINTTIYKDIAELKNKLPENSTIYTWWDYGLAIADVTGFPVYHSGMSQSTPKTWMIAKSFTSDQQTFYNIASFTQHGGYTEIMKLFEDNKTITDAENLMTSYSHGPDNDSNYVLFTFDMVEKYSALAYLSQKEDMILTFQCIPTNVDTVFACNDNKMFFDTNTGTLSPAANASAENKIQLSTVIYTINGYKQYEKSYTATPFSAVFEHNFNGLAVLYIMPPDVLRTSFSELFLQGNYDDKLFTPVYDNYPYSRVYKINKK